MAPEPARLAPYLQERSKVRAVVKCPNSEYQGQGPRSRVSGSCPSWGACRVQGHCWCRVQTPFPRGVRARLRGNAEAEGMEKAEALVSLVSKAKSSKEPLLRLFEGFDLRMASGLHHFRDLT